MNNASLLSNSVNGGGENIYDSKIHEERPRVNKSLGKHQIHNNLHLWTKMGLKIYQQNQPHLQNINVLQSKPPLRDLREARADQVMPNFTRNQVISENLNNIGQLAASNATIVTSTTVKKDFQPRQFGRVKNYAVQLQAEDSKNMKSGTSLGLMSNVEYIQDIESINGSSASAYL